MTGGDHRIKPDPIDPRLGDVPLVEETRAARKADDRMIRKALFQARDGRADLVRTLAEETLKPTLEGGGMPGPRPS